MTYPVVERIVRWSTFRVSIEGLEPWNVQEMHDLVLVTPRKEHEASRHTRQSIDRKDFQKSHFRYNFLQRYLVEFAKIIILFSKQL